MKKKFINKARFKKIIFKFNKKEKSIRKGMNFILYKEKGIMKLNSNYSVLIHLYSSSLYSGQRGRNTDKKFLISKSRVEITTLISF